MGHEFFFFLPRIERMVARALLALTIASVAAAAPRRARRALERREQVRSMFAFGFDSYMRHAWPMDELNPVLCCGRGPDDDASNLNINDVLGNYSLTLIDSLDTLAVMGNASAFARAVRLVVSSVSFDQDVVVQVFEATIRVLGGLLSAHILLIDPDDPFRVQTAVPAYRGELLRLAYDLGRRLLPAFEQSKTGIPHPRVNLRNGVPRAARTDTNTAGAGSLSLEFGMLSRLSGDPAFEEASDRAIRALWQRRDKRTGLVGSNIDAHSGEWLDKRSGLGAGVDSFVETLLKSAIIFERDDLLRVFRAALASADRHLLQRVALSTGTSGRFATAVLDNETTWLTPPLYLNVDMVRSTRAFFYVPLHLRESSSQFDSLPPTSLRRAARRRRTGSIR